MGIWERGKMGKWEDGKMRKSGDKKKLRELAFKALINPVDIVGSAKNK